MTLLEVEVVIYITLHLLPYITIRISPRQDRRMSLNEKNLYPPYYLSPFACYTETTIIPAYIVRPLHREMPSLGFNAINHSLQCRLLWPWQKSQGEAETVHATERANQIKITTMTFYRFEYGDTLRHKLNQNLVTSSFATYHSISKKGK